MPFSKTQKQIKDDFLNELLGYVSQKRFKQKIKQRDVEDLSKESQNNNMARGADENFTLESTRKLSLIGCGKGLRCTQLLGYYLENLHKLEYEDHRMFFSAHLFKVGVIPFTTGS